jgi:hypothetical protein
MFVIVAVSDDYSPLVASKTFFYFAFIFFPVWMVSEAGLCFSQTMWR